MFQNKRGNMSMVTTEKCEFGTFYPTVSVLFLTDTLI